MQEFIEWAIFFIIMIFSTLSFMVIAAMIVDNIVNKDDKK